MPPKEKEEGTAPITIDDEGNPVTEESTPNSGEGPTVTVDEKAASFGWKPEDEWEGDPDMWVPAKEFLGRAPLFERISKYNQRIKQLEDTLTKHSQYQKTTLNATVANYEGQLADLNGQLKDALDLSDAETAVRVQKQIHDTEQQLETTKDQVASSPDDDPAFIAWVEENPWYTDPELKEYADTYGQGLRMTPSGQKLDSDKFIEKVTEEVKARFPHKFEEEEETTPVRSKPPTPSGKQKSAGSGGKTRRTKNDLDDTMKETMRAFIKQGIMTEQEYIDQQVAAGNL